MSKHILVISQYFYPEKFRINDICEEWINRGYKVTVITGIPNYPKGKFFKGYGLFRKRKEIYKGIKIIRIPIIPRGKNSLSLILNYLSFVISGWFWKVFTRIKPDLVFIFEVSPMTQALPGIWFSKRRKIPCYIYVQDLWPENVEMVGRIKSKRILKSISKMVDYIYSNVRKILVTSNSFKQRIIERGVDSDKVIYWPQYAEDFYIPIVKDRKKSNDKLNIMFTGNIGKAQGLEILPLLAQKLNENNYGDKVKFTIVGDGRNKENLIDNIKSLRVESMFDFIEQRPAEEIPQLLSEANVAFLSFSDNDLFKMTIPAKLQSYMACGKPIFAVASGETEKIIKESNCGFVSDPGDFIETYKNLLKFININKSELEMFSKNAIKYCKQNFNKQKLMDYFDELINMEL